MLLLKGDIIDAALIANNAIDWRLRSVEPGVLLKMDIEKAFDKIHWSYLLSILRYMCSWERWIKFSYLLLSILS